MNQHVKIALLVAALTMASPSASRAQFVVELTRFGTCVTPNTCVVEIFDNGPLDNNAALHAIDFDVPIVGQAPTTYTAMGRAFETITTDSLGNVTSILMQLTDATVRGLAGANIPGQIGLISSEPLRSLGGVSGFASLDGEYRSFATGVIENTDLLLQARLGGLLLGLVDPPAGSGLASPVPFSGFDARASNLPVSNLLFGLLDFQTAAGSGFVLPASAEVFATIPEPSTLAMLALGWAAVALWLGVPKR